MSVECPLEAYLILLGFVEHPFYIGIGFGVKFACLGLTVVEFVLS